MNRELKRLLKESESKNVLKRCLPEALKAVISNDRNKNEHKYGAEQTMCLYGHKHDSRKEAMWCVKLHELEKEGKITLLVHEPVIVLKINNILICEHWPDFVFFDLRTNKKTILDVKGDWEGGKRPEWVLKRKMCQAIYPNIEYLVV